MIRILQGLILKLNLYFERKNKIYKNFCKDRNNAQLSSKLELIQNRSNNSIDFPKHNYYLKMANKLSSIQKFSKAYLSLLKSFLNTKKSQSSHQILHKNTFVTDFKRKQNFSTLTFPINALL